MIRSLPRGREARVPAALACVSVALTMVVVFLAAPVVAVPPVWESKMIAADPSDNQLFGYSVAVDGDTAVVGAFGDDHVGAYSGAAYIFTYDGAAWSQQAKLTASDAAADNYFGVSVAVDGDTVLVGAHGNDPGETNAGAVYVFTTDGSIWTEQAKLSAADPGAFHFFGYSVAVEGDTALIGAVGDDYAGQQTGSAYLFTRTGSAWAQEAKLTPSDADQGFFFGISVAVDVDTALVGAVADNHSGPLAGSAYVFTKDGATWVEEAKLMADDAIEFHHFGYSVAMDGDTIVIGAFGDDHVGSDFGSAYVFTDDGTAWTQQAKLTVADAEPDHYFGYSVAVEGDTAVIGAPRDDHVGSDAGSAYVFTTDGTSWLEQDKIIASDAGENHQFGHSVSLSGDQALIGAYGDDHTGPVSGSAYAFRIDLDAPTLPPRTTTPEPTRTTGPPTTTTPGPTTTTEIPVFPSALSLALGTFAALGGAFLVLRRRPS